MAAALAAVWLWLAPPSPIHAGAAVTVAGYDMSSADPRGWRRDLEIEQRAAAEFRSQKLFRIAPTPEQADFVFVIVYDARSDDFAEAAVALRPADYGQGGGSLAALEAAALWTGLSHAHRSWRLPWLQWRASSARDLVKQFCRAFTGAGPGAAAPRDPLALGRTGDPAAPARPPR